MKKIIFFCIVLIGVASAYYLNQDAERIQATLYQVSKGEVKSSVSNTRVGTVKACRRAYLAPAIGGNVARLFVKEGAHVKKGQPLLKVWNDDLKAQVKLRTAQIKVSQAKSKQQCELAAGAKRDAQRLSKLKKYDRIISEEQLDRATTKAQAQENFCHAAKAMVNVDRANLELINAALERTLVRAPFDGTVAEINAELGEYVTPSPPGIPTLPPIDLLDISCLTISAPIDEVDAAQVKVGMSACVTLDAFEEQRCSGKVTRIAPYVLEKEKQARTVEVEVKLTDAQDLRNLLPGYSADIEILIAQKLQAIRVPTEAVLENDTVLLVSKQGLLSEQKFTAGLSNWHFIEVISGLSEEDMIVQSVGVEGIKAGTYVAVQP